MVHDNAMVKRVAKGNDIDSQGGGRRHAVVVCVDIDSDSAAAASDDAMG